jgi:hypothetical protein
VYKYCFKSPDVATVGIDEISAYLTGRLLTASEAVWRILGLKLHKEHPAIIRLDVHLPDQQAVIFDPTAGAADIFDMADRSSSTLLEWFELNRRDVSARQYLYHEIPEHYVWKQGTWFPRTLAGCSSVGRIFSVSIFNHELFALRTLLQHSRGCQNFTDLAMVDGVIYPSFREACSAFGYLHDDSEFISCFAEYLETTVASPSSIRHQFALMLCAIKTINALAIFEFFAVDLCGSESRDCALRCIEQKMRSIGRSLNDDDFRFPDVPLVENNDPDSIITDLPPLSHEQGLAVDLLLGMVDGIGLIDNVMAVIAPAGTGKTLFVKHAVQRLHDVGCNSICVAASCLAATLLPSGKTAHAAFKIPIRCDNDSYCNWDADFIRRMRNARVIFWDEVSMVSRYVAETVDRSFRRLMENDLMFGGKVFVFLGDFRQLPPVVRGGRGEHQSLQSTGWFQRAAFIQFTQNFRSTDPSYAAALEMIGDGEIDCVDIPLGCVASSLDDAIQKVYGSNIIDPSNTANMILAFTLNECAIVNDRVFEMIPELPTIADAVDDLSECKSPDEYPAEYVASLHIHGIPPAHLQLKIGARYMVTRNLNPPNICNGVLAELMSCTRYNCTMRLLSGPGQGSVVQLPRCSFYVAYEHSGLPFNFRRRQFPISPAYCVTVHKSQGQTLRKIGIVADVDAFAHGLVYVGNSRIYRFICL